MSDGGIRATQCPNATDPQVLNDQEILKIDKSHFLQQKNQNFFVKQVMKTTFISFNQRHFGLYFMKKLFHNYQRLSICKRKLDAMNLVHALCIK